MMPGDDLGGDTAADGIFTIKDSGERQQFESGMVRDTAEGKTDYTSVYFGPMFKRWAVHLTKGREKYPDTEPGIPNWTLGSGIAEWIRARQSFLRHQEAWLAGHKDEDHAAAMYFNINLKENVEKKMSPEELQLVARIEALSASD